ncbi:hypothetical protein [Paenibacillus yonginensis]|nr:hypothetical protein [Paenibacillus yonginensis]
MKTRKHGSRNFGNRVCVRHGSGLPTGLFLLLRRNLILLAFD